MYPLCRDCIHHLKNHCKKTNVCVYQSRHNDRLCGEAALFFSPTFLSLSQHHRKFITWNPLEYQILYNSKPNRTAATCTCKLSNSCGREMN